MARHCVTCRGLLQKLKVLEVEPGKDEQEGFVTFQVRCVCS
jgi:hypothetical protein